MQGCIFAQIRIRIFAEPPFIKKDISPPATMKIPLFPRFPPDIYVFLKKSSYSFSPGNQYFILKNIHPWKNATTK